MLIELDTCTIRPWRQDDAESLQRYANNRRISMHMRDRFPFPYEREHARMFLSYATQQPEPTVWAIEVDGGAAGGIGIELHGDVERVSAEIGYWLGEPFWGRGIVTAALQAVSAEAFRRHELSRLFAVPFADNAASIRVLEKAGFVQEGHMRRSAIKNGLIRDQLLFATYRPL